SRSAFGPARRAGRLLFAMGSFRRWPRPSGSSGKFISGEPGRHSGEPGRHSGEPGTAATRRLRDARRRRAAGLVLPDRGGAAGGRLAGRGRHGRSGVRRGPGGGHAAQRAARGAGGAVNAAAVLGGRPVASLRVSEADPRERHRGISHHSLTAYGRVALARADVVVPELPGEFGARLLTEAAPLAARHSLVRVSVDGLTEVLRACPVPLSTMGRGLDEDPSYFLAAAAAGRHAAALTGSGRPGAAAPPGT